MGTSSMGDGPVPGANRLVGREPERAALLALLDGAAAGRGGTLVVRGEPGIGKSRLLAHAVSCAEDFTVLRAAGSPADAPLAWSGLWSLLRGRDWAVDHLPTHLADALRAALHLGPPRPIEPLAIGAALLQVIGVLAEEAPVLVVIDDLHWLDPASRRAILFGLHRIDEDPVAALLVTHLHTDVDGGRDDGHDPAVASAGLDRFPAMTLGGLDDPDAAELLAEHHLEPAVLRTLNRACTGNPLALLEHARRMDAAQRAGLSPIELSPLGLSPGGLSPGGLSPGGGVGELVVPAYRARLAALDAASRFALVLLSIDDLDERQQIDRAVRTMRYGMVDWDELEELALVRRGPGTVRIAHSLVRATVMADADAVVVRRAHAALATVTDGERALWHEARSLVERNEATAARLARLAVDALARGDARRGEDAAALSAALTPDPDRRAQRHLLAGRAAAAVDRDPAPHLAEAVRAGPPQVKAEAAVLTAAVASWTGDDAALQRLLEVELPALRAAHPPSAALVLGLAAVAAWSALDPRRAARYADEAWALAGGEVLADHPMGVIPALARLVYGDAADGCADHGLVELCRCHLERNDLVELVLPFTLSLLVRGRHQEALDLAGAAAARAAARGAVTAAVWTSLGAAMAANRLGRLDEAARWATQGHQLSVSATLPFATAQAAAELALIAAMRGDHRSLAAHVGEVRGIARSRTIGPSLEIAAHAEALGELVGGNAAQAAFLFGARPVLTPGTLEFFPTTYDLIEALVRADRHEAAQALRPQLAVIAGHRSLAHQGHLARAEGLLARGESSIGAFEQAVAHFDAQERGLEAARSRLALGERLRRLGRRVAAREALEGALIAFEAQGCAPWAARCRAELQACGVRVRGSGTGSAWEHGAASGPGFGAALSPEATGAAAAAGVAAGGPLTVQEAQVAAAVAGGQSNREAAAALFVSTKTVETHLTRIYRKLGVRTRSELAAMLSRGALMD
ncbi:MAG: AAA family ATPase [Vicinamibacterales bacterium]